MNFSKFATLWDVARDVAAIYGTRATCFHTHTPELRPLMFGRIARY